MTNGMQSHIAQFRLHFYKGDSIIKTRRDLNREHVYCPEDKKTYKQDYFSKEEPFLKEMGDFSEDGDCKGEDYYYFYTPKDVFFVEYLHEIGNFDYDDSNSIEKWLDESFNEGEEDFYGSIPNIYRDVKSDIDKYLEKRPDLCKFEFERLLVIRTYSYTEGYEYVEYGCNYYYDGLYNLAMPKKQTEEEEFFMMNGMTKKEHDEMINRQYSDMADFFMNEQEKESEQNEEL